MTHQQELMEIFTEVMEAYKTAIDAGFEKLNSKLDEIIDNTPKSNTQSL
jgi:hypothetical protein